MIEDFKSEENMDYLINHFKTLANQLEGKTKSFNKEQRFKHLKKT